MEIPNSCAACGDAEGLLRLVGGQERGEGRLEYCSGGEWGTVCNQGWDLIDARVACAQLIPGGDPNGKHKPGNWLNESTVADFMVSMA